MTTDLTGRWRAASSAAVRACERAELAREAALSIVLGVTMVRADPRQQCASCEDLRTVVGQLEQALESRDVIGQAKGVLMALQGIDEAQAFEQLRQASQQRNERLRAVAVDVARTGSLERWPS